ncbi:MAG TPA: DUF5671 domain-containing protein [Patescibacteria group bacterium]|nr:DUF5671 domain-containing protein [Patescibacteria group bacterium]
MVDKNNAKFAFYYLLSLTALIFMAISVGLIAFGIINQTIADPLLNNYYNSINNQFKFAISALIIATPLYYIVVSLIRKGIKRGELEIESAIRRWLTYFILFVSSLIILGFLISVINGFLAGELTLRFILKALTVFVISGLVFAYYFYDIKQDNPAQENKVNKVFLIASVLLVLTAFVSVWFFMESPKKARDRRLDEKILNDISNLESSINFYYSEKKFLPENMTDVAENSQHLNYLNTQGIEYKKNGESSFEICATFKGDSLNNNGNSTPYNPYNIRSISAREYTAGYNCLAGDLWEVPTGVNEKGI